MKINKLIVGMMVLLGASAASAIEKAALVYGESGRLENYDPYTVHEAAGQRMSDLLFDSLVDVGPGGKYVPRLAKSWIVENGGTSVIFDLRDDVIWHAAQADESVKKLTADDVVTTVRLLLAADSEVPNKERFQAMTGTEVVSEGKVRILLGRAMVDPLRVMMFKVLPAHVLGSAPGLKRSSEFGKRPIGTGPYAFFDAKQQGEVVLKANPKYYRGAPQIPQVVMKSYADQNVMAQSLMFNSLDLVTYISPVDLPEVMGDKKLGVVPYDALSFSFFALNTSRGALKDKRIRQAISYAVNRQEMLEAFFQGKGRLISGPFPPTSWAYNLDVKPMDHDVARAKTLLGEAGLKDTNGDGTLEDRTGKPLSLKFAVPLAGESEMVKRMVLALQGYLATVGIPVELQFMDWLVWKKKVVGEHDYDITFASWSFDDSSNITSLFHSSSATPWGNNFVMFRDAEVDSMLTEADATNDFDKRRAIYQKLHLVLADEAPYVYLWTLMHHAAHNMRVSGVRIEPFSFFKHVASWELGEAN